MGNIRNKNAWEIVDQSLELALVSVSAPTPLKSVVPAAKSTVPIILPELRTRLALIKQEGLSGRGVKDFARKMRAEDELELMEIGSDNEAAGPSSAMTVLAPPTYRDAQNPSPVSSAAKSERTRSSESETTKYIELMFFLFFIFIHFLRVSPRYSLSPIV